MKIIADSGSTKTHWKIIDSGGVCYDFFSPGLNPYHYNKQDYSKAMRSAVEHKANPNDIKEVFFYGAGCASPDRCSQVSNCLAHLFPKAQIDVYTDLLGAARALFDNSPGIVVVLGTGSSVGYYTGSEVHRKTVSLGYILGDEGSGAHMGKELLRRWAYGELLPELAQKMTSQFNLSVETVLKSIYSNAYPARFMAKFTRFLAENISTVQAQQIVEDSFKELYSKHLAMYSECKTNSIGVVGSVGKVFAPQLKNVLNQHHISVANTIQYPIDALVAYHGELK